jgi:hypothetical protein
MPKKSVRQRAAHVMKKCAPVKTRVISNKILHHLPINRVVLTGRPSSNQNEMKGGGVRGGGKQQGTVGGKGAPIKRPYFQEFASLI